MTDPQSHYTPDQQREMLALVRDIVTDVLSARRPARRPTADYPDYLQAPRGCFVTLHHRHGRLRGCIGTFDDARPLIESLTEMAGAATRDPRFITNGPVVLAELNDLLIEISVLTPMQPMEDPLDLRIGTDGIYIRAADRSGCFLPQVAPEQGWDATETLTYCCAHKMGLDANAWRSPTDLEFFRFQAIVFGESAPEVLADVAP
ncbi:MAG: AMMECR1 domain-containing protein [Planctomycetaceae bacterium]|nr:AMMECR1 domain-containing protein [Planctomycetaceae bacterium]